MAVLLQMFRAIWLHQRCGRLLRLTLLSRATIRLSSASSPACNYCAFIQSINQSISKFLKWPKLCNPELSMGPFCVTRSNPTRQLTDPTQPSRNSKILIRPDSTRPTDNSGGTTTARTNICMMSVDDVRI